MIDEFAKEYLHSDLREIRETMLWKLDGLAEYDIRRPLTMTGTNLLGLVKHLSFWESRYFGEVFGRPFPEPLPRWDDAAGRGADSWATEHETREEIVDRYRRVWKHSDATIDALAIDSPGHVPWWPRPDVKLFNILVHMLTETGRHAGHADILREQLDGSTGTAAAYGNTQGDAAFWAARRATIEQAARQANPDVRLAAYAVCVEDGHVLLAHAVKPDGEKTWTLPGGRVEHAEDPVDAVVREVAEETGLDAVVERLLGVDSRVVPAAERRSPGKPALHNIGIFYQVRIVGGRLRPEPNGETAESVWTPIPAVARLGRSSLLDIGLALAQTVPATGHVAPVPVGGLIRH